MHTTELQIADTQEQYNTMNTPIRVKKGSNHSNLVRKHGTLCIRCGQHNNSAGCAVYHRLRQEMYICPQQLRSGETHTTTHPSAPAYVAGISDFDTRITDITAHRQARQFFKTTAPYKGLSPVEIPQRITANTASHCNIISRALAAGHAHPRQCHQGVGEGASCRELVIAPI